jgi:LysM repeat protein
LDKVVYAKNDNTTATTAAPAAPVIAKAAPVAEVPAPKEKAIDEVAKEAPRVSAAEAEKYYTVKKGDTAFNIARRNNITMRQLLNWNNLDFETVKVGQRLRVKE